MIKEIKLKDILTKARMIPVTEFNDDALIRRHEWADKDHPGEDRVVTEFPVEPDMDAILSLSDSEPISRR